MRVTYEARDDYVDIFLHDIEVAQLNPVTTLVGSTVFVYSLPSSKLRQCKENG
jgi:hypothetical protein